MPESIPKMKSAVKLWFETEHGYVFGEGAYELLSRVEKYGTITDAASSLKMSYRQAWGILKKIEKRLGKPLVEAERGGAHGGGKSRLTPLGRRVLSQYSVEKEIIQITKGKGRFNRRSTEFEASNRLEAEVVSVDKGDTTSVVKIRFSAPATLTIIITRDTVEELGLREGSKVQAVVNASSILISRAED